MTAPSPAAVVTDERVRQLIFFCTDGWTDGQHDPDFPDFSLVAEDAADALTCLRELLHLRSTGAGISRDGELVEQLRLTLGDTLLTIEIIRQMATGEEAHPDDQDDTDGMKRIAKYCADNLARYAAPTTPKDEK